MIILILTCFISAFLVFTFFSLNNMIWLYSCKEINVLFSTHGVWMRNELWPCLYLLLILHLQEGWLNMLFRWTVSSPGTWNMYALGLILLVMLAQHSDLKVPAPVQVVWCAAVKRPILCNLPIKSKQYPYLRLFYLYFSSLCAVQICWPLLLLSPSNCDVRCEKGHWWWEANDEVVCAESANVNT
jgi:hypothetical protein